MISHDQILLGHARKEEASEPGSESKWVRIRDEKLET